MDLNEEISTVSALGISGALEITDFVSFYFGRVWWS